MNKVQIAKAAASIVVGSGTGKIVGQIIKNHTDPENVIDKYSMTVAAWVIGAMAADATRKYTDAKIDELCAWWTEHVTRKPDTV